MILRVEPRLAHDLVRDSGDVDRLAPQEQLARLDLRHLQEVLDQRSETVALVVDVLQELAPLVLAPLDVGSEQCIGVALDAHERRPQLVRDGREQLALQAIELAQSLDLRGFLEQPRVRDRRRGLSGERRQELLLALAVRLGARVRELNRADRLALRDERHDEHRPQAARQRRPPGIRRAVRDTENPPLCTDDTASGRSPRSEAAPICFSCLPTSRMFVLRSQMKAGTSRFVSRSTR